MLPLKGNIERSCPVDITLSVASTAAGEGGGAPIHCTVERLSQEE